MDAREGELDPLSGQRAALPVDSTDDSAAARYLRAVRAEATQLAVARALSRKRAREGGEGDEGGDITHNSSERARADVRPAPVPGRRLDYDAPLDVAAVARATAALHGGAACLDARIARSGLAAVYAAARPALARLAAVHPAECTSLATWKQYMQHHAPVPLSHVDTFRVYGYLARWLAARFEAQYAEWAWALLLRTPAVLSGDEVAQLRDVVRALAPATHVLARAFVLVVGTEFGQHDLLQ